MNIAVVIHLYYLDMWSEIKECLIKIPHDFDLFINFTSEENKDRMSNEIHDNVIMNCKNIKLEVRENIGFDILPFIDLLKSGALDKYDLALKIHTKRNLKLRHGASNDITWRDMLLDGLLKSENHIKSVIDLFKNDEKLGIVGVEELRFCKQKPFYQVYWGPNFSLTKKIAKKLGYDVTSNDLDFFAGTMFWFRPKAFEFLKKLEITKEEFLDDIGKHDGGISHALERLIPIIVKKSGYKIDEILYKERSNIKSIIIKKITNPITIFLLNNIFPLISPKERFLISLKNKLRGGALYDTLINVPLFRSFMRGLELYSSRKDLCEEAKKNPDKIVTTIDNEGNHKIDIIAFYFLKDCFQFLKKKKCKTKKNDKQFLPKNLSLYNLGEYTLIEEHSKIAYEHGISAFCIHYNNKTPFQIRNLINIKNTKMKFLICMNGVNFENLLKESNYEKKDCNIAKVALNIAPIFEHKNYYQFKKRPVLVIKDFYQYTCKLDELKNELKKSGIHDIHIIQFEHLENFFTLKNNTLNDYSDWLNDLIIKNENTIFHENVILKNMAFIDSWNNWAEEASLEDSNLLGDVYLRETKNKNLNKNLNKI